MNLVENFEPMGERDQREVIRCRRCGLVQFRPWLKCRRCRLELEQWMVIVPRARPKGWTHPEVPATDIGRAVLFWRRVYGISQKELARRTGMPRQYICKLENHYQEPLVATCFRFAEAFGISMRLLVLTAEGLSDRQQRSKQPGELPSCA